MKKSKKTKKPARFRGPGDAEIIDLIIRFPIKNLDDATHRLAMEYALAVVSGCDPSRVPYPTRTVQ